MIPLADQPPMKAIYVMVAGVVAGGLLGVSISWARFAETPPLRLEEPAPISGDVDRPRVLVDDRSFNFGPVEREAEIRHDFRFTNAGKQTLTLKAGATTCSHCTISELKQSEVAPGETVDVTVIYHTSYAQPTFRQTAKILTNDPEQPTVDLNIFGSVTTRYEVQPEVLVFSNVASDETRTVELKIYGHLSDEIGIADYKFAGAESAPYFEIHSEPIPREKLEQPNAKSGCRVLVTLKPGLPLGPIRQTIRLTLRMAGIDDTPTVEVPVMGTIDADISIIGANYKSDAGKLTIGTVKASEGAKRDLLVLVRGEHRHDVTIKPVKIDPPWMKVTLGEPVDLPSGAATKIPMTIEIPRGSPPENHLGSDQGKYAEIHLETTHPQAKQIRMYVQFVVLP